VDEEFAGLFLVFIFVISKMVADMGSQLYSKTCWAIVLASCVFFVAGCPGDRVVMLEIDATLQAVNGQPLPREAVIIIDNCCYLYNSLEELLKEKNCYRGLALDKVPRSDERGHVKFTPFAMEPGAVLIIPIDPTPFIDPPVEFAMFFPERKSYGYAVKYYMGKLTYRLIDYNSCRVAEQIYSDSSGGLSANLKEVSRTYGDPNKPEKMWTSTAKIAEITVMVGD
jgi:hypothetical protein